MKIINVEGELLVAAVLGEVLDMMMVYLFAL